MRAILDPSVLLASDFAPIDGEVAISAVSLAELHCGVPVTESAEVRSARLQRRIDFERALDPLPLDTRTTAADGDGGVEPEDD